LLSPRQSRSRVNSAIKLADVVVKTLTSAFGPPGTFVGELAGKGFDAVLERRSSNRSRLDRQLADIADSITTSALAPYEFTDIAANDLDAAVEAVADTIAAVPLDGKMLRESGYTATGLTDVYRAGARGILDRAGLGEAESAYRHILASVGDHILAVVRSSPEVHAVALADLTQRLESVGRKLSNPGGLFQEAQSAVLDEYLLTYRLHAPDTLLRHRFVTSGAMSRSLRAGLAYVPRRLTGPDDVEGLDALLEQGPRILIEADPGQGKTTLLRRSLVQLLTRLQGPVPVYVDLHGLAEFPLDLDLAVKQWNRWLPKGPPGWVEVTVRQGQAVVLLDGVDHLLSDRSRRVAGENDLDGFLGMAGQSTVVVAARCGTFGREWIERHGFVVARLVEPTDDDIFEQVRRWHEAVAAECASTEEQQWVADRRDELSSGLCQLSDLRGLARQPLLSRLMCETFLDSSYALPQDWIPLVRRMLDRLAALDCRTDDPILSAPDAVRDVQQEVAVWAVHNAPPFDPDHLADNLAEKAGSHDAAAMVERLLFRGALLRRGLGGVSFVNDHARDHLAAGDLIGHGNLSMLREKARQVTEPRLVVAAAGHGSTKRATELISGLLDDAALYPQVADALTVMACCGAGAALSLDPGVRQRAIDAAADLAHRGSIEGIVDSAIAPLALDMLLSMIRSGRAGRAAGAMAAEVAIRLGDVAQPVRQMISQGTGRGLIASSGDVDPESTAAVVDKDRPGGAVDGGN
jgi:hypothetical protein